MYFFDNRVRTYSCEGSAECTSADIYLRACSLELESLHECLMTVHAHLQV